jgi:hypothetical protein
MVSGSTAIIRKPAPNRALSASLDLDRWLPMIMKLNMITLLMTDALAPLRKAKNHNAGRVINNAISFRCFFLKIH